MRVLAITGASWGLVVVRSAGVLAHSGGPLYAYLVHKVRRHCAGSDSRSSKRRSVLWVSGHYRGNGLASGALVVVGPAGCYHSRFVGPPSSRCAGVESRSSCEGAYVAMNHNSTAIAASRALVSAC